MSWMIVSVLASLSMAIALTLFYSYLYIQERDGAVGLWALGWLLFLMRFALTLTMRATNDSLALQAGEEMALLWGGLLLVAGTWRFIRRDWPAWVWPAAALASVWIMISSLLRLPVYLASIPSVLIVAGSNLIAGAAILRSSQAGRVSRYVTGWGFVAWGLHKAHYPLVYRYAELGPLAHPVDTLLALLVGIGLMLAYLERAQGRVIASEVRLRTLIDNVADAIYVLDMDGRLLDANRVACETLGYSRDELLGMTAYDINPPEYAPQITERIRALVYEDESYFRSLHCRRDGSRYPVEIHSRRSDYRDRPAILSIVRDISERITTEQALRAEKDLAQQYLDIAGAIILVLDRNGHIVLLNRRGHAVLGCEGEDVVGLNFGDHFTPEGERARIKTYLAAVVAERSVPALEPEEDWVLTRQGEERIVAWRTTLLRDADGAVLGTLSSGEDVTERRRAENALRESEQRFRLLVDSIGDLVFTLDTEQRHTAIYGQWPQRAAAMADGMLGRTAREIMGAEAAQVHEEANRRALAGEMVAYEWAGHTPEGDVHYLTSLAPLRDTEGRQVVGIVGVARDITEIKRAQQRLQETERRMATLLGNLPGMAYRSANDENWTMELVSDGCLELTGYTAEELVGDHRLAYADLIHPDDRQRVYGDIQQAVDEGISFRLQYRITTASDTIKWVWEQGSAVHDDEGRVVALEGFITDVTDRVVAEEASRANEERYRSIFAIAASLMVSVDRQGIIRDCNERSRDVLGYEPDELIGRPVTTLLYPDDMDGALHIVQRILTDGVVRNHELRLMCSDGRTISVSANCSALTNGHDEYTRIICIVDDLTERKRLEDQLRQAHKMEAIGRLAGTIAHDFNNLLMVMNGYGQMVYDGMAPEAPLRGEMGEVLEAGKRAAALTGQLLMFSRQNRAEMQVVRLNKVLAGVARMLERLVGEDVVMELRLAEELGHIKADPRHLEQVVMNLAANARDAMPTGGTLAIETAPVVMDTVQAAQHVGLKPGRYAMLVVSDTGTGIKPEVAAHLFEPFFTTKEAGRGTGLGLSTVYAIVKESQGGIYVYSEWGQGTTFRIYLPLVDDPVTRATENRAVCLPRGSETILVVEDQEQVRRLVTQVLRQLGYRVLAAGGAEDALALYQEADQVHLVLTDVVMPHMSGPEVVERLRQLSPDLPALYMSGYAGQTISRHLAPGVPLVQKPFTAEQLAVQVRRVLDAGAPQGAPAS